MAATFEAQKNRKAFIYTAGICISLLLLFILISWKVMPPTVPVIQDLIEINLGNNEEGFGEEQPLKKGNRTPARENAAAKRQTVSSASDEEKVNADENAEDNAAPVSTTPKGNKATRTVTTATPVTPTEKQKKPKLTYPGSETGPAGNNPSQDNDYVNQGRMPGRVGDDGIPTGNKDSYGNTPGGTTGGPKVIRGNRRIVSKAYNFTGELQKATINAIIRVSATGKGTFAGFDKGTTNRSQPYADAIRNYLRNIEFDTDDDESTVTVRFNFNVN